MSLLNRELDYFLTICETRNLARAADVLGVSQPALTRSLQRLEARFATQLFVRAPRGVELTPIGAALRERVEKARMTLNDAEKEVGQLAAGKIGKVRIGAGHIGGPPGRPFPVPALHRRTPRRAGAVSRRLQRRAV